MVGRSQSPSEWSLSDRIFTICFGVSLGLHLLLLIGQLLQIDWLNPIKARSPLEVIYEYQTARDELQQLQEQVAKAKRETVAPPSIANLGERPQIRIPDRPVLTASQTLAEVLPGRPSVVDLTNLVDAARGDPVLLSYFSAIREQIQRTANHRPWLSGESADGLVYVSFLLSANGAIDRLAVVLDRSAPSSALRDIAVTIVKTAAPFPPFPPSMTESQKTIVVPLEFLYGS